MSSGSVPVVLLVLVALAVLAVLPLLVRGLVVVLLLRRGGLAGLVAALLAGAGRVRGGVR
jgi:hypothetical protein